MNRVQRNTGNRFLLPLLVLSIWIMLSGCRTSPDIYVDDYPAVISVDGSLLLHFNLEKDRTVVGTLLEGYSTGDLSYILEKSDSLTLSMAGKPPEGEFTILAEGSFPRMLSNMAIGRQDGWEKHKDGLVWWENRSLGLYASVPYHTIAILSNRPVDDELEIIKNGDIRVLPELVMEKFESSVLSVYSKIPGEVFYDMLNIPSGKRSVKELLFGMEDENGLYRVSGFFSFTSEDDARRFSTALKLGLIMKMRESGKASVMKIVRESSFEINGSSLAMDNIQLTEKEFQEIFSENNKKQER